MNSDGYKGVEIPDFIRKGSEYEIGSYTFTAEKIIEFATAFDPQHFHMDHEAAGKSMFGGLCASGWHTTSVWMKLQRKATATHVTRLKKEGKAWPDFGPSPGMENLKWLKPVYANDTITYTNKIMGIRRSDSKPDWWIMSNFSRGENQHGDRVMQFDSSVFLKIHPAP